MCVTKLKVALAVLVTVLVCAGTGGLTQPAGAADRLPVKMRKIPRQSPPQWDGDSPAAPTMSLPLAFHRRRGGPQP